MRSKYVRRKLGELVRVKHGFAFKGEHFVDEPTSHVLLTPGNFAIGGGFQDTKLKFYRGPVPEEYVLKAGDLVVTMTDLSRAADTLGFSAVVPKHHQRVYLHNQRIGLVEVLRPMEVSKAWLHYLMCTSDYRAWVVGSATGSTVKHTSPSRICDFEFDLPTIYVQKEAAATLDALENRIELLRQTNATLESIAQALFKSWFIDFDPVRAKAEGREPEGMDAATAALFPAEFEDSALGLTPKGWTAGSVYEVASVIYGAPFASKLFNTDGNGQPLVRIRDLRDEAPGVWTPEVHPKGYLIRPGDIVVGMDGEFRAYLWGGESAWLNQRVCCFQPIAPHGAAFVRCSIAAPLAHIEATEVATTVIHLGKGDIDRFKVVVPTPAVANAFSELTAPLYARIVANKAQGRNLAAARDTLLPRLISGKLRLPEVTQELEAV